MRRPKLVLSTAGEEDVFVSVVRLRGAKGRYVVTEGDPTDRHWTNYLGGQRLLPGNRLHELHRTFSADEITDLRELDIEVIGPMGKPVSRYWEGYRPRTGREHLERGDADA